MDYKKQTLANAIRFLSIDAVENSSSGHPGMPMGMADIAEVLWKSFLQHNPSNPKWFNRDRFVLSNGHGSMLLYSLLHLTGYKLSIQDLKNFRKWKSNTPGHPEVNDTPGVETTTGPLGQGLANAVGMAIAESLLAAKFNKEQHNIIDHYTYCFVGDGCLMEGISHEVCSLAGSLSLNKLIVFYDDNNISIDGKVEKWFSDDTPKRFEAYNWNVIKDINGHDAKSIKQAIKKARNSNKPSLICCKTIIGFGSPNKQGSHDCHGSPLGQQEVQLIREKLNWSYKPFEIPKDIYAQWDFKQQGKEIEQKWNEKLDRYKQNFPELASELERRTSKQLPNEWADINKQCVEKLLEKANNTSTRKASQMVLNEIASRLPELIGGSADLTDSNKTLWKGAVNITDDKKRGQYLSYGVREFGMSAIMNGIALHGGFIPYGGTFLVFADYAHNAVRMSGLMKQKVIYVYSHDSIALGEDGPTHQPFEQLAYLRTIPNLHVWRPCDEIETAFAWKHAIEYNNPSALILSRQNLKTQNRNDIKNINYGGYILKNSNTKQPEIILIATGSEVELAMEAATQLEQDNINTRVISIPCLELFLSQTEAYKQKILPKEISKRLIIEAGVPHTWLELIGKEGRVIGINQFGSSAPGKEVMHNYGFNIENIIKIAKEILLN